MDPYVPVVHVVVASTSTSVLWLRNGQYPVTRATDRICRSSDVTCTIKVVRLPSEPIAINVVHGKRALIIDKIT